MDLSEHEELLLESDVWLPPDTRKKIIALIAEAYENLRGLGYARGHRWGPVDEDIVDPDMVKTDYYVADRRLYYTSDRQRVVGEGDPEAAFLMVGINGRIPIEDAKRFGLFKGPLPQEKGETIVIIAADKIWPLYSDSAGPEKLAMVPGMLRKHFSLYPFDEFSGPAFQCIEEHEQIAFEGSDEIGDLRGALRTARRSAGHSQARAAEELKLDLSTVARIEQGRQHHVRNETLARIRAYINRDQNE